MKFKIKNYVGRRMRVAALLASSFCVMKATAMPADDATNIKNGEIKGRVIAAETGEPFIGANVRVLGSRLGAATDAEGRFAIARVPVGTYTLLATAVGYESQRLENLVIKENAVIEVKFELSEAPVRLADVVVTPGHFAIMQEEPVTQQMLTAEDIQNIPHFGEDIYRAVRRLPGVSASDYSARFTVRGGDNNEVLVLLDGLELYEPFHLKDINGGALSIIDVEAIGGVNLMTGGFTAEYGNKLSGVFDINTIKPETERHRTSLGLSLLHARVMSEGTFGNGKGHWLASARRGYFDLVMQVVEPESKFRPTYYDVLGKWQYRLSNRHTFSANVLHAGDNLDLEEDGDVTNTGYGNSYGWLGLQSFWSPQLYSHTVASVGRVRQDRRALYYISGRRNVFMEALEQRDLNVYAIKQDWSFGLAERHFLKWGFNLKRFAAAYDYFNSNPHAVGRGSNDLLFEYDTTAVQLNPNGSEMGFYFADRMRLFAPLTVELGMRYDRASHTDDENLSPRVHAAYALGKATVLRLGWGRFYQAQGLQELQAQDGDADFYPAELAEHRVLGVEHQFENGVNLRVEAYQKRLSQLRPRYHNLSNSLEFFPEVDGDRVRLEPERGDARGVEVFAKRDAGGKLAWWASYAYAIAEDEILGQKVLRNFDQRHTIYLDATYRPAPRWRVNVAWQYHTGWPYTPATVEPAQYPDGTRYYRTVYGKLNSERYPAFHSMDVKVSRYFDAGQGRVNVFLEFINFYNRGNVKNYYFEDFLLPNGEIAFEQGADLWLPRLPSIGVSWEF